MNVVGKNNYKMMCFFNEIDPQMYKNKRRIRPWYAPAHFNTKNTQFLASEIYAKYNDVVCANQTLPDKTNDAKIISKCISSNKNQ